ncbi:MAG: DUF3598 family protein [Cyanothece sp. SIO2G6]|nr:DUF3598 family protein [Cyanothece sp. SIO2G6]
MDQWSGLRKNVGEWHGSFTQCSPLGEVLGDIPSILRLEEGVDGKTMRLSLKRFPEGQPPREIMQSFSYPGPGSNLLFFETGAFSQGAGQWFPSGQFGTELGFVWGDRRLRLVQLFEGQPDGTSQLTSVTVIRETRAGCEDEASSPLTVMDLCGHWRGNAVTISPTTTHPINLSTDLVITVEGTQLSQKLSYRGETAAHVTETVGRIEANCLWFEQSDSPVCVVLLPGGGSIAIPTKIKRDRSFFLEAGWLIAPHHRQRLIRRYNPQGQWLDLTLVEEFRETFLAD